MNRIDPLHICYHTERIGTLSLDEKRRMVFVYDPICVRRYSLTSRSIQPYTPPRFRKSPNHAGPISSLSYSLPVRSA